MNTPPSSSPSVNTSSSVTSVVSSCDSGIAVQPQYSTANSSDVVFCQLCQEIYVTPKIIPCGHVICLRCVKILAGSESTITCPKCTTQISLPPDGPEGFVTLADLDRLCQMLRNSRKMTSNGIDDEQLVTCYHIFDSDSAKCPHCCKKFCKMCEVAHCEQLKTDFLSNATEVKERLVGSTSAFEQKMPEIEATMANQAEDKTMIKAAFSEMRLQLFSVLELKEKELLEASDKIFSEETAAIKATVNPPLVQHMLNAIDTALRQIMRKSSLSLSLREITDVVGAMKILDGKVTHIEGVQMKDFSRFHIACADFKEVSEVVSRELQEAITPSCLKIEEKPTLAPVVIFIEPIIPPAPPPQEPMEVGYENNDLPDINSNPQLFNTSDGGAYLDEQTQPHPHSRQSRQLLPRLSTPVKTPSPQEQLVNSLHQLAREGNLDEMRNLLRDVKWTRTQTERVLEHRDDNDFGRTILHQACAIGHVEMIQFLVQEMNVKIDVLDSSENKCLPIQLAAANGHLNAVAALLLPDESGKSLPRMYNTGTLRVAIINGHLPIVKLIISRCPSLVTAVDSSGKNLLHYAAEYGYTDIVMELMRVISLEETDNEGNTPLHLACKRGKLDVVTYLKDVRPDLLHTVSNTRETPVDMALMNNQTEVTNLLQSKRARKI